MKVLLLLLLLAAPSAAQEPPEASANPLAALNEQLEQVLASADLPFSAEQERAIALMMEDRRRASEDLFGDLMDFRDGPTQGQQGDRLRSAIEWMRNEFVRSVADYMTPEQAVIWREFQATQLASPSADGSATAPQPESQTQYVRINNNSFTAEDGSFGDSESTEVIQRGGVGAWHGNAQFLLKDDALNARNAFAGNKPPYQERRLSVDVSGPSIPGRLTSSLGVNQSESENVTTVRATLPDGVFALGITRPNTYRQIQSRSTYQIATDHSLNAFGRYATEESKDQGIGDYTLPMRASNSTREQWNIGLSQFSSLSSRSIFESRLQINGNSSETLPLSEAVRIDVLDAFESGGAQNRSEETSRNYQFGSLYTRIGENYTLKTGVNGSYRMAQSVSTNNFGGTFTFSSLDAYRAGAPATYRVTRGDPVLDLRQLEMAAFVQADLKLSSQATVMLGARYEAQQNLDDYNNLAPRVGLAYAIGQATVVRGGGGIFYSRLQSGMVENQRRFDGTRQFEIVIDEPSYPDPFAAGRIRQTFPSVRLTDPHLVAPYFAVGMIALERTFFSNLLTTAAYEFQREYHRLRTRNLNAPYDARLDVLRACGADTPDDACLVPDPTRGNLINLESTGNDIKHSLRLSVRKRFSIFNGSLNYEGQRVRGDVQGGAGTLASDAYDLRADWGRSPQPMHNVSGNLNASLPLGVFLSGRVSYNSGRYYTIRTGTDVNRDSNVNDRPPGAAPNSEHGPKYLNVDFNISKAFFFRGSGSGPNINVFANMTNAFNHVHYGTPSGVLTSPNFGRSTSASNPREIEAGIRFQF